MLGKRKQPDFKQEERENWPNWVVQSNQGKKLKLRSFKSIVPYKSDSEKECARGKIRVLKIYNRFADVSPDLKKWPEVKGYERFNVCKNTKYQELSPMVLGPVYDESNELYANNIEDGWQCSKVFSSQVGKCDVDSSDEWIKNWSEYSKRGRFSSEARRHRSASRSDTCLFSYYMGEKLTYVQARKRMYCKWYAKLVRETKAYKDLEARHLAGKNLLLVEYDGLDRNNNEQNVDLTEEYLRTIINDPKQIFGHGLVLATVLLGYTNIWDE